MCVWVCVGGRLGIEIGISRLQGEWFIHNTTAAVRVSEYDQEMPLSQCADQLRYDQIETQNTNSHLTLNCNES